MRKLWKLVEVRVNDRIDIYVNIRIMADFEGDTKINNYIYANN